MDRQLQLCNEINDMVFFGRLTNLIQYMVTSSREGSNTFTESHIDSIRAYRSEYGIK